MSRKVTSTFLYSLAVVSILGFGAIILKSFFDIDFLTTNMSSLILIVLGFGLVFEGKIKKWLKFKRGGIQGDEITHIVTGVVGFLAIITGVIDLLIDHINIEAIKGIIAVIAVVIIIVQTWVVD